MKKTILTTLLALSLSPSAFAQSAKPVKLVSNKADLTPNIPACEVVTINDTKVEPTIVGLFSLEEAKFPQTFQPPAPFNDMAIEFKAFDLPDKYGGYYIVYINAKLKDGITIRKSTSLTKGELVTNMQEGLFVQKDDTVLGVRCFWENDYTDENSNLNHLE